MSSRGRECGPKVEVGDVAGPKELAEGVRQGGRGGIAVFGQPLKHGVWERVGHVEERRESGCRALAVETLYERLD